jgi:YD repeat-containing protein
LGRKVSESEPYFEGQSPSQWNTIAYDDTVYPAKVTATAFNGKQTESKITGSTTTVKELNGYARTTTKTTDALGNVVSTTDKGGTIQFSYNAAGQQIKAKYGENSVVTKYDAWGRKSEFNDPSNGVYQYEYDGFGRAKKTISPKGTKEYTYNNYGQLVSQKEFSTIDGGQSTDKLISFTYSPKGLLTAKSGVVNGQTFSSAFTYDPHGRLLSSTENSNGRTYSHKGLTYDPKGRVVSYEKELVSSGTTTTASLENVYSDWSGELSEVRDSNSGKTLWKLTNTNAKGQTLEAKLGAVDINNSYDANGFLTEIHHSSVVKPNLLQVYYSFNAIKNELVDRKTLGDFNIIESFDYDDNNRLINWTDPVTGVKPSANRNVYDLKGRIMDNDQVGVMKYENSAKIYQPTGMTLNQQGAENYNGDLIQKISYNENNDPVFIDGEKGDVGFMYGLTAMRQKMSYGGNFEPGTDGAYSKFYNEDGSFEIVRNNETGSEKHIIYIGGTPYESNIIYLKNYKEEKDLTNSCTKII